jgi:AhpD family alkylhydroperoxidase
LRVDYAKSFPKGLEAMLALEAAVRHTGLEPLLLELVKLRASQLNGCAYCLDMHAKDARARGEDEQRLHVLAAWREAPFYSPRERAALAWCETLTLLPQNGAPDDVFAEVEAEFSPEEIAADVSGRGDQRLEQTRAVGLRTPVGDYVSPFRPATGA